MVATRENNPEQKIVKKTEITRHLPLLVPSLLIWMVLVLTQIKIYSEQRCQLLKKTIRNKVLLKKIKDVYQF